MFMQSDSAQYYSHSIIIHLVFRARTDSQVAAGGNEYCELHCKHYYVLASANHPYIGGTEIN